MKYPRCKVCLIIPNASTLRGPIDLKLYYNYLNKVQIQFREKFLALQNMTTSLCSSPQLCGEFYLLSARCFGFHGLHFPCCSSQEPCFQYQAAAKKKKKKKKALINPLYSTCLAPNSRHKQLANSWWTKWSIQQLKEQDISLRNWWQMNPKPKRTIDIGQTLARLPKTRLQMNAALCLHSRCTFVLFTRDNSQKTLSNVPQRDYFLVLEKPLMRFVDYPA